MASNRTRPIHTTAALDEAPIDLARARTGEPGPPITLCGVTYHRATLTGYGARALGRLLFSRAAGATAIADPTSGGAVLYQAAVEAELRDVPGKWAVIAEALTLIVDEALPDDITDRATPAEVIAALDAGIDGACLGWLEAILKNSAAQRARADTDAGAWLRAALGTMTVTPPTGGTEPPIPPTFGSAS